MIELAVIRVVVARDFGVAPDRLCARRHTAVRARARHAAIWLASDLRRDLPAAAIARAFRRDRTAVGYAVAAAAERMAIEPEYRARIERLAETLRGLAQDREAALAAFDCSVAQWRDRVSCAPAAFLAALAAGRAEALFQPLSKGA